MPHFTDPIKYAKNVSQRHRPLLAAVGGAGDVSNGRFTEMACTSSEPLSTEAAAASDKALTIGRERCVKIYRPTYLPTLLDTTFLTV